MRKSLSIYKESATISIFTNSKLNIVDRKLYNILIWVVKNGKKENNERRYTVPLHNIQDMMSEENVRLTKLKDSLKNLNKTTVEYNVLKKDKEVEWMSTVMLSYARIKDNIIEFEFPLPIEESIFNPRMYAEIDLRIVKQLNNKYSLALYEVLKDYANSPKIPEISFDDLKKTLDVKEESYKKMNMFKGKILEPSIEEINKNTDIELDYEIIRRGNKPVGVQFYINKKSSDFSMPYKYSTIINELNENFSSILINVNEHVYSISYFEIRDDTMFSVIESTEKVDNTIDLKFKIDLTRTVNDIVEYITLKLEPLMVQGEKKNVVMEL